MSQHHDPVHPDSDHLTAEVLADLGMGLLDETSAAHAEHHLTHCADCAALRDQFPALVDALAELPSEQMPEQVWQRLSAALAAEPVVTPEGSATVVPLEAARKRRWTRPGIGLVAGAAGVALLGAIVVPSVMNSGNDSSVGTASDTAASGRAPNQVPMAAYAATQSGTKYQEAALDSQVTQLVEARPRVNGDTELVTGSGTPAATPSESIRATTEPTESATGQKVAPMATDPAAAQACLVGYLQAPDVQPLAIDIGTWRGEPAAIIVLPNADPELADVFVLDPTCAGPGDPLFYFATVSR